MTFISIPLKTSIDLSHMVRHYDPLPGATMAHTRVNSRRCYTLSMYPTCWLPWNRPQKRRKKIAGKK